MKKSLPLIMGLCLLAGTLIAQDEYPFPSLSPKGKISQEVGNTLIQIEYERPSARKRKVFGGLVPWNQVWRTGAGHCTKIRFDRAVQVGGQSVEKGTYSLFSIPNPEEWIIILNEDTSLYGSAFYQAEKDVARFVAIPRPAHRYHEALTLDIDLIPNDARIYLSWENTQVSFEIATTTDEQIERLIQEDLMTGKETRSMIYAGAAEYHLYQGTDLMSALQLAGKALEIDHSNGWARELRIKIFDRLKLYERALQETRLAIEEIEAAEYEREEERQREIAGLKQRLKSIQAKMAGP
jgi:tetratricopeptide (TPR) repeat protein